MTNLEIFEKATVWADNHGKRAVLLEDLPELLASYKKELLKEVVEKLPKERKEETHAGYTFSLTGREWNECLKEVKDRIL